jgi:hypothetical protein
VAALQDDLRRMEELNAALRAQLVVVEIEARSVQVRVRSECWLTKRAPAPAREDIRRTNTFGSPVCASGAFREGGDQIWSGAVWGPAATSVVSGERPITTLPDCPRARLPACLAISPRPVASLPILDWWVCSYYRHP